ncbi:MAG: PAS domain S-box protein [Cytophagales bacterium]|nr:MAG: PAS domain S-box protein [Cytophagales bacterium]
MPQSPESIIYESIINSPHLYLVKRDLIGRFSYVNPAFAQRFSFLSQNLIGEIFDLTVHSRDIDKLNDALSRSITHPNENITLKVRKKKPDGDYWWVQWEVSAIKDSNDMVVEVLFVGHDITESQINSLRVMEYSKKLNTILDSITDGFCTVNYLWAITQVNRAIEQTLAMKSADLVGKNLWDIFPKNEHYSYPSQFRKAMHEKLTTRFEEFFMGRWFSITAYPSSDGITVLFQDISEQKKKEDELYRKETKLNAVLNSTSDTYVLIDKNYKILSFNIKAHEEYKNFAKKELKEGVSFLAYLVEGTEEGFKKNFQKALEGTNVGLEMHVAFPNEPKQWRNFRYFPVYDNAHQIFAVSFNAVDINMMKQQEQKVRETEIRLRAILDSTSDINVLIGLDYKIISLNKEAKKRFSAFMDKPIAIGDDFRNFVVEGVKADFLVHFAQVVEGKKIAVEKEIAYGETIKTWHAMRYYPVYDETEKLIGVSFNSTNITEQKRQEEALEEKTLNLEKALIESNKLSMIIRNTNDMVTLTDVEGKITWVNEAFVTTTGYTLAEVIGKKPGSLLQGAETDRGTIIQIGKAIKAFEPIRTEILNYSRTGQKYWVELSVQPILNEAHKPTGFMAIQSVVTSRKESEQKILHRNKLLEEIAFIQAHEVRRPVANILGLINLIRDEDPYSAEVLSYINHLEMAAKDLDDVIHRIVFKTNEAD